MTSHALARSVPRRRRLRVFLGRREGATMVEMALLFPVLLALLFGIIEVGHLMWTIAALNMAVQDTARCVSVSNVSAKNNLCATLVQMQAYASARTWGLTVPASEFTLSQPACGYQVTATHPFVPVISYIPLSFTVQAQACFPQWQ